MRAKKESGGGIVRSGNTGQGDPEALGVTVKRSRKPLGRVHWTVWPEKTPPYFLTSGHLDLMEGGKRQTAA